MSKPILKINSILENWASTSPPIHSFTVENVLFAIKYEATYDYVFRYLISKKDFELEVSRIFLCPNNHKAFECKLDYLVDDDDLPECHVCGEEIINDLDHSFLVFSFTDDYIEECKKKIQMKLSQNFLVLA